MPTKRYRLNTAGARIITAFPRVKLGERIADVEKTLLESSDAFDTIDYLYIVDDADVLKGVISIKELHRVAKNATVEDVMKTKLIVAYPRTHQERIVYLALSSGLKAIPVIDRQRKLLGIVPYDTILRIFNQEVREDIFKFGGIFHRVGKEFTTIKSSARVMIKTRLPWLIIGVFGGIIAASIVTSFEYVLEVMLALAAFTPVLAYLSGAVGAQSQTLAVRSMALDPKLSIRSYFIREFVVSFSLASTCGLLLFILAMIGWQDSILGIILGLSVFLSIISAVLISTVFPFIFKRMNLDPAIASGPFATMIGDVATVTIYFTMASLLIAFFGIV